MSNPNDDLSLWVMNHMPVEVLELGNQLGIHTDVSRLSTDGTDHTDSIFFSRGLLATYRTAILLFVIEHCLPNYQRWLFYWLMMYSRQILVRQVYVAAYVEILLLWYFQTLSPRLMYLLALVLDCFIRIKGASTEFTGDELLKTFLSQVSSIGICYTLLQTWVNPESLTGWLESLLGPTSFWSWAIFPILPGLLFIDERAPINTFTPERGEGLVTAAVLWGCHKLLPNWIQWSLFLIYSAPDYENKGMTWKWVLRTLLWMWFDTPVLVAYGLHLFANLFPEIEFALRQQGGGPSIILRRERYGWVCFVAMSFLLRLAEVSEIDARAGLHSMGLPLLLSFLFVSITAFGIGFLQKKSLARAATFKHEPIQRSNQIRLLRVRRRYLSKTQQIYCDMIHVDLASPPKYTAISYRWSPEEEEPLSIMIDGTSFPISQSLHALLLTKSKPRHNVLFWIDAICINQSDAEEKSQQVSLMRRIYEEASSTIGWLGHDPDAGKALELIQRVNQTPYHLLSHTLQQESDSGWKALRRLVANSWFQRVWIIQEIAVAKSPRIRYGEQELDWKELVRALALVALIVAQGSASNVPDDLLHSRYIVNALVIENIRICFERINLLHLEDMLKLGVIFQATLPVDKVFAFLGIAEERNRGLLSLDYSADIPNLEVWHAKNLFHELYRTIDTINDLKGTMSGLRNSRRSQMILRGENGINYIKALGKDQNRILQELRWLAKKRKGVSAETAKEYDVLRPDYSNQTTPESVYSLVAKIAVGKSNARSIIRHAGIGLSRNEDFGKLPSWVPDWSSTLQTYILPSRALRSRRESPIQAPGSVEENTAAVEGEKMSNPAKGDPKVSAGQEPLSYESIRDAGFGFHDIHGRSLGSIRHLAILSEDVGGDSAGDSADIIEAARVDFHRQLSNYTKAFSIAQKFSHERYKTGEGIESAFFRTVLADIGSDGRTSASEHDIARCKSWIYGVRRDCQVAAALREPVDSPVYRTQVSAAQDPETILRVRKRVCANYLFARRMQCSTSTKLAHMVRTTILPSFDQYRLQDDDAEDLKAVSRAKSRAKDRNLSFFDNEDAGPLAAYSGHADYTLGRKLAITDSGRIGLVPWGARENDIFVHSSSEKLCLLLRRSDPCELDDYRVAGTQQASWPEEMFRLVGEAFIHDLNESGYESKKPKERNFKMW